MTLTKAKLIPKDGVPPIDFMFNPTELVFEKIIEISENKGAHTQDQGQTKVAFANTNSYRVTINKILFDTYETGEDVVKKHIEPFRKAVQFVSSAEQRTPLYTFTWGQQQLLRCCFIEKLTYKLTLFSPEGTPLRAVIDSLTLKEADEPKPNSSLKTPSVSNETRQQDSPQNRQNGTSPNSSSAAAAKKQQPQGRRPRQNPRRRR